LVKKVLYCPKCLNVQAGHDRFSRICSKCGNNCKEEDLLSFEDIGARLKEMGYPKHITDFFSKKKEYSENS